MSTRLNTHLRGCIITNALAKAGVDAEQAAYDADRRAWTEELRVHLNGAPDEELEAAEKKALKAVRMLPKHMIGNEPTLLARNSYLCVNLAGANLLPDLYDAAGKREDRIVPRGRRAVLADNPLVQRFYDLEARQAAIVDKRTTVRAQVKAAINSVTTVKRLLVLWPEAKELLPANLEEARVNLPALKTADLNAMLGLPTEEVAA